MNQKKWVFGIICIAALLRVYRLDALTEFLGDQGRTMLIMRDFVEGGIVPLAGPTTLSGHHLGPFFYYLLLPGYLVSHTPTGVALWMAALGVVSVYVLYQTVKLMFGIWPARLTSFLWAISPFIIASDRVIWEPNLVPLFALLFVYLLYRAHKLPSVWIWVVHGATVGVLVQLHYPNVFFIGFTMLYFGYMFLTRKEPPIYTFRSLIAWSAGCFATLTPFLFHEYSVSFRDVTGIAQILGGGAGEQLGKRMMVAITLENAFRIFGRAIPFMSRSTVAVVIAGWLVFTAVKPTGKNMFISAWLLLGLLGMARFTGVVHDHYLYFLIPVPFLMIGSVLSYMKSPRSRTISVAIIAVISVLQFQKTDIFRPGRYDIERTRSVVRRLQSDIGTTPFSFTLVGSRSFSDLHYRYYMSVSGLQPMSVTGDNYRTLAVICDSDRCPVVSELTGTERLTALCFDPHCGSDYPSIALLRDWSYIRDEEIRNSDMLLGRIYLFDRKRK